MSFSDSDWTSEAVAPAPGRRDGAWAWALVLGIAIGAAGATLVYVAFDPWPQRERTAALAALPGSETTAPAAPHTAASVATAPATLLDGAPPAAGPAEPASTPRVQTSPVAAAADPLAATGTGPAARPSAEEQRRKERAWARFYHRPASCDGNPTTDQLIECANHFIRSKREFDERWKAGTL